MGTDKQVGETSIVKWKEDHGQLATLPGNSGPPAIPTTRSLAHRGEERGWTLTGCLVMIIGVLFITTGMFMLLALIGFAT